MKCQNSEQKMNIPISEFSAAAYQQDILVADQGILDSLDHGWGARKSEEKAIIRRSSPSIRAMRLVRV